MIRADLLQVSALEATIQPTPWSAALFDEELALESYCRILEDASGQLLGYSVARLQVDEWHLLTLGISLSHRRQGGAKRLLADLIQQANSMESRAILLEVRASNRPARMLYQDRGFHFLYTRRGYYRLDPGNEDAILLVYPLSSPTGGSSDPQGQGH